MIVFFLCCSSCDGFIFITYFSFPHIQVLDPIIMSMFDEKGERLSIVGFLVGSFLTQVLTLPSREHFQCDSLFYTFFYTLSDF